MAMAAASCSAEGLRPSYHFTPPFGWMNDPCGLTFLDGEYHIFYQFHPFSTRWGSMHWGHAVSRDLVRWRDLPAALAPDELGHIFSGSIVHDGEAMLAAYTNHHKNGTEVQSIASSVDRGRTWTRREGNPVLRRPTDGTVPPRPRRDDAPTARPLQGGGETTPGATQTTAQ